MDSLVLDYLQKRGFSAAAGQLEAELRRDATEAATKAQRITTVDPADDSEEENVLKARAATRKVTQSKVIASLVAQNTLSSEDLMMFSLLGAPPSSAFQVYADSYDSYRSWTLRSLDHIKVELLALCFPLFTSSYLSLVRKGASPEARLFFERWQGDFSDLYSSELRMLSVVTAAEQLREDEAGKGFHAQSLFVRCCVKSKFKVVVSQLAFSVLTGFLAQQELLLAACIINDRVMFSRVETVPSTSAAQQGLLLELVGYTPVSSVTPAQLPQLLLGVPGKGKGTGPATVQMPAFLHDELYREWLQNVVLRNFFAKEKREREAVGTSRGGKRSHVESGGNVDTPRLGMGDPLVPSVLFATLTNAHDGMACLEMDRAGEQAVGGFQDSCVRVWNLAGSGWPGAERGDSGSSSAGTFTYVHPAPQQPSVKGEASSSGSRTGTPRTPSSSSSSSSGAGSKQTAGADEALPVLELRGHTSTVYGVSQEQSHSHGRLLLSCSGDRSIRLWDTNVQQSVGKYLCAGTPWDVQFSPIDYYFAAAAADRSVSVYSTDRVAQVRVMFGHASDATCLGWHPNAAILLSGSDDKTCRLWDLRTGACQRILRGCPSAVSSLVVSPNGDKVAGGTDNGTIHVWDIASGSPMALLQGHKGAVHSLAFSEAGDALVSGGADCSVRTWDMDKLPALSTGLHEVAPQHAQIPIQQPARSMHTKFSPVFHVCYTPRNLVLAGGPFTLSGSGLSGEALQQNSRREEEVVAALGLSFARAA